MGIPAVSGREAGLSLLVRLAWTIAKSSQAKFSFCSKFLSLQYIHLPYQCNPGEGKSESASPFNGSYVCRMKSRLFCRKQIGLLILPTCRFLYVSSPCWEGWTDLACRTPQGRIEGMSFIHSCMDHPQRVQKVNGQQVY